MTIKSRFQKFFSRATPPAIFLLAILLSSYYSIHQKVKTGTLIITFINTANGKPVVLRDSFYVNPFGERYNITKLKYYISNIAFTGTQKWKDLNGYYLMNAATDENKVELQLQPGKYNNMQFLLGVDSMRNCSGAQTGALDPLNDMFWTWNTGYVMFKLEGTSTASTADLKRLEYHVGGYKGENNVATKISFDLNSDHTFQINEGEATEIVIETNLDNYWRGNSDIYISEAAVCMTTGKLAKKIASNFSYLFSIKKVQRIP
ncbi:MAG: MbnP family protein [Ferruginibacter sp.]